MSEAQSVESSQGDSAKAAPASSGSDQAEEKAVSPHKNAEQKSPEAPAPLIPRLEALNAKRANLEATLASLQAERASLVDGAKLPSGETMPQTWSEEEKTKAALAHANAANKHHIALLSKYNEIKDIGQGLMGLIADQRGVRVGTVMKEFGMDEKD